MAKNFLSRYQPGTRSLRTQLAVYFIPIAVLPAILISFYATHIFQQTTTESLERRASSERDAIVSEVEDEESDLVERARADAAASSLKSALKSQRGDAMREALSHSRATSGMRVRLYSLDGACLYRKEPLRGQKQIAYLPREALSRVKAFGETFGRFFSPDDGGFVAIARILLRDRSRAYGILEEELPFTQKDLAELKNRRQADVIFLSRDFSEAAASFALSSAELHTLSVSAFPPGSETSNEVSFVRLGGSRYAGFLFNLPSREGRIRHWGYLAVFLPMASLDATMMRLRLNLIFLTVVIVLGLALLIFFFSNRIVRPIEMLVLAMKRIKTGRIEQIPTIDSAYEIEYLVHAFNEMTRNVESAKKALEEKVEELKRANQEIKSTQSHLVQSAKMISLGQIVAGVAHELNNPIGFIYSNMHHLSEYLERFQKLVNEYRALRITLPSEIQRQMEKVEKDLEIDFILRDMADLTRSCMDGANRTKEIVLGLRTFSRMDESLFRLADLHEGLKSTLKLLIAEFKNRVAIHEEYGEIPLVECSLSQLNQVFMNLLSNAAQAIEGRGDIWIRTWAQTESVVIEIEDSGSGIPRESLEKIFDPFFTTKKVGQGTGLGLSIAYGLVQKHHGTITVKSELGKGTTFRIALPIRQPVRAAS